MGILNFSEFSLNESSISFSKSKKSEKRENGKITRVYDNGFVNLVCTIPYKDKIEEVEEYKEWDCVFKSKLGTLEKKLDFDKMREKFMSLTLKIKEEKEKIK